jgi:hypothetical protein
VGVLVVRPGRGANCSSVGSVVDMLFVAGVAGGALLLAVNAALSAAQGPSAAGGAPDPGERAAGAGAGDSRAVGGGAAEGHGGSDGKLTEAPGAGEG